FEESKSNVRAICCSNIGIGSSLESENMSRTAFSLELDCKLLSNVINTLYLTEIKNNIELDLELLEFICLLNFEKDITSISCSLPDEPLIGLQFDSWEVAKLYIREYGKKRGFVVKRYRVQLLSDDRSLESNGIYMGLMNLEHNHNLNINNVKFAAIFRKFDQDIMSEIEYAYLLEKQKEEPIMFIQPLINTDSDRLCSIFWMTEDQIVLWSHFSDIVLHDNTLRTNKYNYPLFLFILVNNDRRSRLRAQAFLNDETKESYEWAVFASSTIANVVEALDSRMQKEALKKSFMMWKYKSTTFHQPFIVENIFNNMCESVLYQCEKVPNEEAFDLIENQLSPSFFIYGLLAFVSSWPHMPFNEIPLVDNQNNEDVMNIEDHYDHRQAYLKTLINSVSKESIQEVWQIIPYMHYFKLMVKNSNALFHVMLMSIQWFQDNIWNKVELASNEYFIGVSSKHLNNFYDNSLQRTYLIPKHYNNVQEEHVHQHIRKKLYYDQLMGHFKKVLHYSIESNDQNALDDLILSYISEKETNRQTNMQSEYEILRENINSNCEIKLFNGHVLDANNVKDPLEHIVSNQKENKHKADNSDTNNTVGGRKCGLCHKTGHYAPKYPTKNSDC
ncbi:17484_t:CDS:10, partial [Dentiscutata erythropus]